ncbi:MAG: molecular chaperone HtpG [Bacteroidales bacterium]|nr:molecular chaperone HtpG [Bacteroidales bacterium]MBR0292381.1 molecular chaperone HtpG [Bacteroidales bacterium]
MAKNTKGQIGVTTENIFPVIKQFLYSDHEIFLRELVANAVDAEQKLKALASTGTLKGETGDLKVQVELDEKKKTLKIIDNGIGMTEEEVDRYINQIAFSSAGEFLEKYKDQTNIIGHFGLGFYSAFMVAKQVTIESLSWQEGAQGVKWTCDGTPEFTMGPCKKEDRGTVITLQLDDESAEEFGTKGKIRSLLDKYCKFMPVPVVFGKKTEWKDGKSIETDEDEVINSIEPIWTKAPSELKDEDYLNFYKALYPMDEEPMFWIHLNVDYPFTLTGVLYFPKIKERMAIDRNKIQLYCNQMFVTDHVDNIVPDFLTLLHGVIDSPDIPLNVSRSYLQSDANVKKISTYITKKVADRLEEIFKEQRAQFEEKWDNIKLFIEYGMLSDEKFCERAMDFALLKNTDGKYFCFEDYRKAIEGSQTDKDKKVVYLYATDTDAQWGDIQAAKNLGYDVLLMDCELDSHFVNMLEQKLKDARFARVDSDTPGNLIPKEDKVKPEMSDEDKKTLEELFKAALPEGAEYRVEPENLGQQAAPVQITQSEFMRRWREMSAMGGGMNFYGSMPQSYEVKVNMENPIIARIWADREGTSDLLRQVVDLALLGKGMLKGKALADFIERSEKLLG